MTIFLSFTLSLILFSACTPKSLEEIQQQVANDTVAQYELSKKSGDLVEVCVKAQLVAESFNQAKDEINYLKWKSIQECDCLKSRYPKDEKIKKLICN